jgi:signal peptidase II
MNLTIPRRLPWLLLISALVIFADRLTKTWVMLRIPVGDAIPVVAHILRITHLANFGGNFGVFAESAQKSLLVRWELIGLNSLVMLIVLAAMAYLGNSLNCTSVGLALALGGSLGCLHDRIAYGAVVDFIEVHIFSYHWPDFNIGDIAIVTGACLLALDYLLLKNKIAQPRSTEAIS